MDALKTIACLLYPNVMSLDLSGPLQVFASANDERQRQGLPGWKSMSVSCRQRWSDDTATGASTRTHEGADPPRRTLRW